MQVRFIGIVLMFWLVGCQKQNICSGSVQGYDPDVLMQYCAYKEKLKQPGPPLGENSIILGQKGKEAVRIWISDMETGNGLYKNWEYGPILEYAQYLGKYNICDDKSEFIRAQRGLQKYYRMRNFEYLGKKIRLYCVR